MELSRFSSGQLLLLRTLCVLIVLLTISDVVSSRPSGGSNQLDQRSSLDSLNSLTKQHGVVRRKRNLEHLARIVKRSAEMQNTKSVYKSYHDALKVFITSLKSRLGSGFPMGLDDKLDTVTKIIKPTDSAFSDDDVNDVTNRIFLTFGVDNLIYSKTSQWVDDKTWLKTEHDSLLYRQSYVKMSFISLKLKFGGVSDDKSVGGLNDGVYDDMNGEILKDVQELVTALRSA